MEEKIPGQWCRMCRAYLMEHQPATFSTMVKTSSAITLIHDLRHTFVTTALQNGIDIKTVSGMPGHFSAGFTLVTYA